MRRISLTIGLAAAMLAAAGCGKKQDVPQQQKASVVAVPSNSHAGQFLTDAIAGDIGEIQLAQIAQDKASDKKVRDFAQTLAADHAKSKDQATQLAASVGASVPAKPTPDFSVEAGKLQALAGRDFDQEFVSFAVNSHQEALTSYQAEAGTADPAPVVAYARQTVPVLKTHLEMAEALATGLNGKGS